MNKRTLKCGKESVDAIGEENSLADREAKSELCCRCQLLGEGLGLEPCKYAEEYIIDNRPEYWKQHPIGKEPQ